MRLEMSVAHSALSPPRTKERSICPSATAMKFLSTKACHPLAFLGLLLVTVTAFPTPEVSREDVTDDTTPNRPIYTTSQKVEAVVSYVHKEILELKMELCNKNQKCMSTEDALIQNNLKFPKLTEEDGCLGTRRNRDSCLLKITSGLLEFQIYLDYIQNKTQASEKDRVKRMQDSTKLLIEVTTKEVKDQDKIVFPSPTANAILMEKLQSQQEWEKTVSIRLILQGLNEFLEDCVRSIRKE